MCRPRRTHCNADQVLDIAAGVLVRPYRSCGRKDLHSVAGSLDVYGSPNDRPWAGDHNVPGIIVDLDAPHRIEQELCVKGIGLLFGAAELSFPDCLELFERIDGIEFGFFVDDPVVPTAEENQVLIGVSRFLGLRSVESGPTRALRPDVTNLTSERSAHLDERGWAAQERAIIPRHGEQPTDRLFRWSRQSASQFSSRP